MDDRARQAFERAVRQVVSHGLDQLSVEVSRLRREVETALRTVAGVPPTAPDEDRRALVAELRQAGLSQRAIAAAVHAHRATVAKDLQVAGVPRPAMIYGRDGRRTRGPSPGA